jgi:nitrogen fixation protein NifX
MEITGMDVKIAVATSDGVNVDQHFGRARSFMIYRVHDEGRECLERRENNAPCSGQSHNDRALERTAAGISDCSAVVVAQIGAAAIDTLVCHRIMAFTLPGTVEDAFDSLVKTRRFAAGGQAHKR